MTTHQQAGAAGQAAALPEGGPATAELVPGSGVGGAQASRGEHLEAVFCAIAGGARDLVRLVDDLDGEGAFRHAAVLRHLVGRIGWLADLGLSRCGSWTPPGVDGGEWLLTTHQAELLGLKGGQE